MALNMSITLATLNTSHAATGRGVGTLLLDHLLREGVKRGVKRL